MKTTIGSFYLSSCVYVHDLLILLGSCKQSSVHLIYVPVFRKIRWKMSQHQKYNTTYFCAKYCAEPGTGEFSSLLPVTGHWHETLFPGFQFHHLLSKEFLVETTRSPSSKLHDLAGGRESCDIAIHLNR